MRKILKYNSSFFTKLAFAASYGNGIPAYFALLTELLSCIQILYIILTTSFTVSNEKNLLIVPQIRSLFSFLGLYDGASAFETEMSTELVWYAISAGLCAYMIFFLVLAIFCLKGKNLKKGVVTLCTVLTTIHSKVLFCPIYYFYINSILNHERCAINNQSLNMCGTVIKAFTLIFVMINGALAVLKEVLFYQSYKNSNPFVTKNNFYALIQLIHKITVLPILVLSSHSLVVGSILNFLFTLPCLILLLLKLPYYNIKMLRTTVYLSTITTTLSFILIWKTLVTSRYRIFELILILTIPVFIKVVHERLNAIFEKILSLRATSPEHIMHLYTLTEHCLFHSEEVDVNRNSKYKTLFKYGVLEVTGLDVNAMENVGKIKNFKDEVNLVILDELLRCYKTNAKSRALMLFITQFYMEKIKNASQTVVFIQKMQNMPLSIPIQNTLVKIKEELKDMLFIAYSQKDPSLEFIKYFKYREISDTLKATIASEVQLHIDFWQLMAKDKVEVRRVIHIARQADILASKVNRMWEQNEQDLIKNFPVPLMLYRVYLSLVRGVPHIAEKYIDDSIGVSSKVTKSMEKWFAQEKASIVGSMQKGTLGIVLDASSSVQNLFNIKKEDLIGRNVNILMPSMVQEKHNFLIDRYNQKHEYALDVNNNVYGKTVDGQFFDAQLEIKVYPYIDKGIGLIGMLTKKHACELMFFLDMRGNIADCSSELLNDFRSNFTLSKHINIEEIAPELKKINEAFNVINVPKSLDLSTYTPGLKRKKTGIDNASKAKIWSKVMKEDGQASKESRKSIREHQIFTFLEKETHLDSAARLISTCQNETQKTDAFLPQTTEREQIMIPLETNLDTMKFKEEPEAILPQPKNIAAIFLTHLTTKQANPVSKEQARREFLNLNEAEKICEELSNKKEKKVSFFTQDALSNTFTKLTYFVKVDIFWFENQFYKVVKVRKPTKKDMTMEERTPRWQVGSKRESQLAFKSYGNSLLDTKLKNERARKPFSRTSYSGSIQGILGKKDSEEAKNTLLSIEALQDNEEKSPDLFLRRKNKETKRKSEIQVEKILYDLLKKGKESTFTKIYFSAFYFAMLLMVILATINFVFIRNSFKQIQLAATLVDMDSERHVNLIKMWSICNTLYTFLIQNKTTPSVFLIYNKLVIQQADIITTYTRDLNSVLPDITSNEIINAFYTKDIHFWEPFADKPIDASYDVFNGINILVEKLLLFKSATRYKLLDDPGSAIFALNNTVNDLSISAMAEVTVTIDTRDKIYASNLLLLLTIFIIEITAMAIIFLSLIGLAFKIIQSKEGLFTVLSTMSSRSFDLRSKELVQFRNCIQESLESRKFIMHLNSFIDEGSVAKNEVQARDFSFKFKDESKFRFFSIKVKISTLLFLAFVLFAGILSLQIVSTTHSSQSIAKLKKIDAASSLTKKMRYQVNILNGNIVYWLNFYGRANVKIYNEDPSEQLDTNLAYIRSVNSQFVSIFTAQDNFYSPDIDAILHSDPCSFAKSIPTPCSVATKGEILGLLGVNLQFYDILATYVEIFRSNMTIQNAYNTAYAYLMVGQPYIATTDVLYSYIRASLFKTLSDTINEEDGTNKPLYIGTCFVCVIITLLVRLIVLKSFKRFDISKYKILMLIPQRTLLSNKIMMLYLKNEFRKELNSLL